jgi:hydroxylamine reductase (hybrid-cluster protein)
MLAQEREANLSQMLSQAYSDRFATQTATLAELNTQLQQLASGRTPQGFDAATLATLTTRNINLNAAATRASQQAVSNQIADQGGGAANPAGITSGVQEAVRGGIAATEAANLATAQENVALENIRMGRENLIQSISGRKAMAEIENPVPFATAGSSANESAFKEADIINQQQNQATAEIAGLVTGGISDALTFGAGALGGGGLKGGFKALAGDFQA